MRKAAALLVLLAAVCPAWGQKVTLPAKAEVKPGLPTLLAATADGANVVWMAPDTGIVVIDGTALGGDSKRALVFGSAPGTFRVWALTAKGDKVSERAECLVTVGDAPPPAPPGPTPPGPVPPAPPTPVAGLKALVVYESADLPKLPAAQSAVLFSKNVRDYLNAHCPPGVGGWKEWRIWDQSVDASAEPGVWADLMKRPRQATPWLVLTDGAGKVVFEGPLPENADKTLELLKKYGGP